MIPHNYPRPNMYRNSWRCLDGWWDFDFYDDEFIFSHAEKISGPLNRRILVPYTYQTELSGIGIDEIHERVVYRRTISLSKEEKKQSVILHFGAVDFHAEVWIDETVVGYHTGGYTPFSIDISSCVQDRNEVRLALVVEDRAVPDQPRGKQAHGAPFECWYTAVTGIWQSVWLEFLPEIHIKDLSLMQGAGSDTARYHVQLSAPLDNAKDAYVEARVMAGDEIVAQQRRAAAYPGVEVELTVPEAQPWSPEEPNLYRVLFYLIREKTVIDRVESYVAFRDVELRSEGLYINGKRYFQKLVLMQGFRQESGYSAPSEDSFDEDISRAQEMGFNGCRMHIKFEDPRFLYAADRRGFLVWGEAPSFYSFSERSTSVFRKELTDIILRDRMHPSLVTWVIGNESWGLREITDSAHIRSWLRETVELTHRLDPTRPVISNDGWEHLNSDIMTVHSYEHDPERLRTDWARARRNERYGILGRQFSLEKLSPDVHPWILSEFGAVSYLGERGQAGHWGYGDIAQNSEDLLTRFAQLIETASSLDGVSGWCYTQFSDIEKEQNGLLFADRTPKVDLTRVKQIVDSIDTHTEEN